MALSLIAIAGRLHGQTILLTSDTLTIGRDSSNQLHLADPSLSRAHAVLTTENDRVTLADLDSANGTFVNGIPIKTRLLEHGDQITVGESVLLFVGDEPVAAPDAVVELNDALRHSTIEVRREDAVYLRSDQAQDTLAPTSRRARDLNLLLRVSARLGTIRTLGELQRVLIDVLFDAVPADRAAILFSENEGGDFISMFARRRQGQASVQISHSVVRHVLAQGVGVVSNEPSNVDAFRTSQSLVASATRSVLCAPMRVSERERGALYLASSDASVRFDVEHLQLVMGLAGLAGLTYQNVRHIERLQQEASELRAALTATHNMVGESAAMQRVNELIAKVARTDSTVLILGESGTGKELAARAIHANSPRARGPFVAINAAAIADTLLESELFGHEKGAFTGAIAQKRGHLELAEGGTIFLDEIGELNPAIQVKFLRVLQEHEIRRVGGTRPIKIDVRFIAATNKDLGAAVKEGRFRQDLYYRLNVVVLRMPALRERPEDIPLLANFFLNRIGAHCKRRVLGLSPDARACLMRHDWPGNVRELENAIERAVVLGSAERLRLDDLPESVLEHSSDAPESSTEYHHAVRYAKQQIVIAALVRAEGNRAEAARQLGLHPNNLHRLIRNLNVRDILKT